MADTTGVVHAAIARHSASSENAARSSSEPPPRASTITSTSAWRSSRSERTHQLARRRRALHGALHDLEPRGRKPPPRVLDDVVLGGGVAAADEPDQPREPGEGLLAIGREQALGGERGLEALEPREQVAEAEPRDGVDAQRQLAGAREQLGPAVHVHAIAVLQRRLDPVVLGARHPHLHGRAALQILQRPEREGPAGLASQLGDLALHPDVGKATDPARQSPWLNDATE